MRNLFQLKSVLLAILVGFPGMLSADDGTDDPDFDYLPPEEVGIFGGMANFARSFFRSPSHAGSFTTAKRRLYNSLDDAETFYCGCPVDLGQRTFDRAACDYVPVNDNDRAKRTEAEHILPAYWIAHFHPGPTCWKKDEATCGSARECCLANDERFKKAHNDLVNLTPAIGELNNVRSNLTYAVVQGEPRLFGSCDFETDSALRVTEPREDVRGDIARVYFYMRETYELEFPDDLSMLLDEWDDVDPISPAEVDRNERILDVQGTANGFVSP